MPEVRVLDFVAGWDIDDNRGIVKVQLESGSDYHAVPDIDNPNEFHIILTLLQGPKPVFFNSERRAFVTKAD